MKPERCFLRPNYEISQVITGLWQVADLEKDGSDLDLEAAAANAVAYASAGLATYHMPEHYGRSELITRVARATLQQRPPHRVRAPHARLHTP